MPVNKESRRDAVPDSGGNLNCMFSEITGWGDLSGHTRLQPADQVMAHTHQQHKLGFSKTLKTFFS